MKSSKYFGFVVLTIILVYTTILFSNTFSFKFVEWDDNKYITENPFIKDLSISGIKNIFSTSYFSNYHPITTLTWAIEYKLFGFNPKLFHLDNLLLHLINIVLVFYLIKLLLKDEKISLVIALFFAIHPMHVESVVWISERKDLLYALFYISSIILYIQYIKKNRKMKWYILSLLLFIASLLSKSMAVTLPVVLLVIDFYLNLKITKQSLIEKIPFFILSIVIGIITIKTQTIDGANSYIPVYSFFDRIFLVSYAVVFYVFKALLPINMSALHPYPEKVNGFLPLVFYLSFIAILIAAWFIYKSKKLRKDIIFGFLIFLVTISVVIQLMPIGQAIVAERYTYIPYLGLFIIVGLIYKFYKETNKKYLNKIKNYTIGGIVVLVLFFSFQTYSRTLVWKNTKTLYTDIMNSYPDYYYGYFLMGNYENQLNNLEAAKKYYEKSIKLNKNSKLVYNNLGYIYFVEKNFNEALLNFNKALLIDNKYVDSYINRGNLKIELADFDGAITDFNKAISLNENNWQAYFNRAIAKTKIQDIQGAITDYNKVIILDRTISLAYLGIAKLYFNLQDYDNAIKEFSEAIKYGKENTDAYFCRGNAYYNLNKFNEAIKDYDNTIILSPIHVVAINNRGIAKYTINNKIEGCNDIKKAFELGYSDAGIFYNTYCK